MQTISIYLQALFLLFLSVQRVLQIEQSSKVILIFDTALLNND